MMLAWCLNYIVTLLSASWLFPRQRPTSGFARETAAAVDRDLEHERSWLWCCDAVLRSWLDGCFTLEQNPNGPNFWWVGKQMNSLAISSCFCCLVGYMHVYIYIYILYMHIYIYIIYIYIYTHTVISCTGGTQSRDLFASECCTKAGACLIAAAGHRA